MLPIIALLLLTITGTMGFVVAYRVGRVPDRSQSVGPFEVVTQPMRFSPGWETGRARKSSTDSYSLRYKGHPFSFVGKAGMFSDSTATYDYFNAMFTFPAPTPAVVVNVGDPNNRSFFYLVREVDGAAKADLLGEESGGVSGDWLDPAPGDSSGQRDVAVHWRELGPGRWLLLGQYTVLDVQTFTTHHLTQSEDASLNDFKAPIVMSPDGRSFVRFGYLLKDNAPALVIFDMISGNPYTLPIVRSVMRFNGWEEIDAGWVNHYFEWRRVQDVDRLVQREKVVSLPYHGTLTVDGEGYREYRVQLVKEAMRDSIAAFLEQEFGARQLPPREYASSLELEIGKEAVHVMYTDDHVGVWMERGTNTRLVAEIAARFDAALKTGKFDALFGP
ncbi:MAG: hypothetical protein ABJD11_11345 [Gemmatimonadota bacterium]